MRFEQPLDQILGSPTKVRVLRFLCRRGGEWTGRQVARELGMNPVTAHAALRELHRATVVDLRKAGNSFLYSLRDDHYLVRETLRPLFQKERKVNRWVRGAVYLKKAGEFSESMLKARQAKRWNAVGLNAIHCTISACHAVSVYYADRPFSAQKASELSKLTERFFRWAQEVVET